MKETLLLDITEKKITIGIVGLGYVGLPLAIESAKNGFKTIGFEVQKQKIEMVNKGKSYITDIDSLDLKRLTNDKQLVATEDFRFIRKVQFIVICVPTPLNVHQEPNLKFVKEAIKEVARYLTKNTTIVLESTIYPGTTESLVRFLLEDGSGLKCGEDFFLGVSPERVNPGDKSFSYKNTPKVVGAIGNDAAEIIAAFYKAIISSDIHIVSSPAVAEMEKLLENTYRNINIGLINEIAILCERMGIDCWEVIAAAKTKPYGFQAFYPGPGPGGHCVPIDPHYLSWKAKEFGFHISMIETATKINDNMPEYCVSRIAAILNRRRKSINGAHILVLGVAYKPNVNDYRESSAVTVIEKLEKRGALVEFYDPYINYIQANDKLYVGLKEITPQTLRTYNLVVIACAHSKLDYKMIQSYASVIFDMVNAMNDILERDNIERI